MPTQRWHLLYGRDMSEDQIIVALGIYAGSLYYTWKKAYEHGLDDGYDEGYNVACYDVAHGNITVSLKPPREDS
jgi:hypothetical protein